jgi:hypothetical protein
MQEFHSPAAIFCRSLLAISIRPPFPQLDTARVELLPHLFHRIDRYQNAIALGMGAVSKLSKNRW